MASSHNGRTAHATKSRSPRTSNRSHTEVGKQIRGAADAVISHAERGVESAQELTAEYLEQGKDQIDSLRSRVSDYVQERPLQALAIAAGAGAVVALLAWRR